MEYDDVGERQKLLTLLRRGAVAEWRDGKWMITLRTGERVPLKEAWEGEL